MWREIKKHPRALGYAIAVHVLVVVFLTAGLEWRTTPTPTGEKPVIQAVAVDEKAIDKELEKLKQADQKKKQEQLRKERELKKLQQQIAETEKKKAQEQKRLKDIEAQRKAEARKREQEQKAAAEKQKAEAARLAKIKQEQEALARKQAEETKRLAELEAQRKIAAEQARQEELQRQREAEERQRQAEIAAEQQRLEEAERQRRTSAEADRIGALIQGKVERSWLRPPGAQQQLKCTVRVRLIPGGDVISASVVRSSGNDVFDRSAETAVLRASPLPVPNDPLLFERFREFDFEFNPKDA